MNAANVKSFFKTVIFTAVIAGLSSSPAHASVIQHIGNYSGWDSVQWDPLAGLDDADDGLAKAHLDFVGDATDHTAYWGAENNYLFFRMRLDVETVTASTFRDSHFVLIDAIGYGTDDGIPDFGFVWDSSSNQPDRHGLEMSILGTLGDTWGTTRMTDVDGSSGQKGENDINGGGRTADGYVQSVDGNATATFGSTTFLDFAVSLSYLSNNVPVLVQNPNWRIQLGSVSSATDHNPFNADLAGNISPSDAISLDGWSQPIAIPEPATAGLIFLFGGGLLIAKRLFRP